MPQPEHTAAQVSNSEFLRTLARGAHKGQSLWVTSFAGNPDLTNAGNWFGRPYNAATHADLVDGWRDINAYFSVAALRPDGDGELSRRKTCFARLLVLVADDMNPQDVTGSVSYVIDTSPGKSQVGIFIDGDDDDAADPDLVVAVKRRMGEAGFMKADSGGNNIVRYVRLPVGQNQKPRDSGAWQVTLAQWSPNVVLSLADACAAFGIDLDALRAQKASKAEQKAAGAGDQSNLLRETVRNILDGDVLHESIARAAASLIATGMHAGSAINLMRSLMDASAAPRDDRFKSRYADIPRAVETAAAKFASPVADAAPQELLLDLNALREASAAVSWAVKHVLPADSIGVMFGGSGTFKSFIALDLALHIAHGLPWLGRKTKQSPVIYIAAEGGTGLWRRIDAWHRAHKLSPDKIKFYVVTVSLDLITNAQEVAAAAAALNVAPGLIIVDTMSQTFSGEENSANEVAGYLRALGTHFRAAWRCAVLVLHHSGHQATERPRGSSAIRANVDFMVGVFREEKEMIARLECHKQKDGEMFEEISFKLESIHVGFDEDGDEVKSLCASYIASDEELKNLQEYERAKNRSGTKEAQALALARTGMPVSEWRMSFYASGIVKGEPHAKKMAFYRIRDRLIESQMIDIGTMEGSTKQIVIVKV